MFCLLQYPQITFYAIGTKKNADDTELRYIAGSADRARKYKTVSEFSRDLQDIVQMTCKSVAFVPTNFSDGTSTSVYYDYKFKLSQPKVIFLLFYIQK